MDPGWGGPTGLLGLHLRFTLCKDARELRLLAEGASGAISVTLLAIGEGGREAVDSLVGEAALVVQ